jgi:hypothetical protein
MVASDSTTISVPMKPVRKMLKLDEVSTFMTRNVNNAAFWEEMAIETLKKAWASVDVSVHI